MNYKFNETNIYAPHLTTPHSSPSPWGRLGLIPKKEFERIAGRVTKKQMTYKGITWERNMYYGAPPEIIQKARELRKNMTEAEKTLWSALRKKQLNNTRFYRQHPIDIFIADFYCHKFKLAIELDGKIHRNPEIQEHDKNKTAHFEKLGITVLRFTNDEIFSDIQSIIKRISAFLK